MLLQLCSYSNRLHIVGVLQLFELLGILCTSASFRVPLKALPRPATFDFGLKGEAQERPDRHDTRQQPDALRGKWRRDSGNDVRPYEQFQPQQNSSPKIGSILLVGRAPAPVPQPAKCKKRCGNEHAANDDDDTCELKKLGELVYKSVGLITKHQLLAARAQDDYFWDP